MSFSDSKDAIRSYHVVALRVSGGNLDPKEHNESETMPCESCDAVFSIHPAEGITPQWPKKTYSARLKLILADDHTNNRKHYDAFDLGA